LNNKNNKPIFTKWCIPVPIFGAFLITIFGAYSVTDYNWFQKKTQKTPKQQIEKAEQIKREYYESKK